MSQPRFGRMIPAMVTPFNDQQELDRQRIGALALRLAEKGSDALVISGTTGESPTVSHAEKLNLLRWVKEALGQSIPIIANVGNNCTKDTIVFAQEVAQLGIDGIMCVVPYYNKPPQEGLYQHFSALARAVDLPLIMYNIPSRCVINMEAETTLRLARNHKNIVAVKEASGNLKQIKYIIDNAPSDFCVYSGDDAMAYDIMKLGGAGVISTIGNVAPERMKNITNLCAAGNFEAAYQANEALMPLMNGLFETANPISVKEALNILGCPVGGVRLPLIAATDTQTSRLSALMREVGVLGAGVYF